MNVSLIRKTAHIRISITIALGTILGVCVAATLPSAAHATTVAQDARQPALSAIHDFPWGYHTPLAPLAPLAHHAYHAYHADFPWS
ncbi:hypothetical protein GCM10022252_45410 [Streptosporangium oxazolinicum]|uniref:Secreted protein n=1 Tax=Streptosporangium oxazolinicum TaxID=909287 RepID=A0ABP8B3L6_9ACTN